MDNLKYLKSFRTMQIKYLLENLGIRKIYEEKFEKPKDCDCNKFSSSNLMKFEEKLYFYYDSRNGNIIFYLNDYEIFKIEFVYEGTTRGNKGQVKKLLEQYNKQYREAMSKIFGEKYVQDCKDYIKNISNDRER